MQIAVNSRPPENILRSSLSPDYLRQALGRPAANKLLEFSTLKNGVYVDNNYSSLTDTSGTISQKFSQKFAGQKIPAIILAAEEAMDPLLLFHTLNVEAMETERYRERHLSSFASFMGAAQGSARRPLSFLNDFLLIVKPNGKMIFICDDHPHVAYALALARESGLIGGSINLFHVDEHLDNAINLDLQRKLGGPRSVPPPLSFIANCCKNELNIDQHLAFTAHCGLVEAKNIHYVLTEDLAGPPKREKAQNKQRNRLTEGKRITPTQAPQLARQLGKVVLDLDLDFFAYLYDPLFPTEKRSRLQQVSEQQSLGIVKKLAKEASIILIATSPDYFAVPVEKIKGLIRSIVAAA